MQSILFKKKSNNKTNKKPNKKPPNPKKPHPPTQKNQPEKEKKKAGRRGGVGEVLTERCEAVGLAGAGPFWAGAAAEAPARLI